jgi:hypothetical protein
MHLMAEWGKINLIMIRSIILFIYALPNILHYLNNFLAFPLMTIPENSLIPQFSIVRIITSEADLFLLANTIGSVNSSSINQIN